MCILSNHRIEKTLKELIEKCVIKKEPKTGSYSWVVITRSDESKKKDFIYKFSHTIRLEFFLKQTENDNKFIGKDTIVIKAWHGADYLNKVIKRIFRSKKFDSKYGGKNWFNLSSADVDWLNSLKICECDTLQSNAINTLQINTIAHMKAEGLY